MVTLKMTVTVRPRISVKAKNVTRSKSDTGASLILAMIFLIVVSLIVISISSLTAADLHFTQSFSMAQSETAAADGAATVALQTAQGKFDAATLNAPIPVACVTPGPGKTIDGVSMVSWCSTWWNPMDAATRLVTISTCLASTTAQDCAMNPFLQVQATFDDYPASGNSSACLPSGVNNTTCGASMHVNWWTFAPQPPMVASVTLGQPGSCSARAITVTGSGFTPGSSVLFVSATNYSLNEVLPSTNVNATESSISATPPTLAPGTWYIVVRGSTGSNVFGPTTTTPTWTC